MTQSQFVPSILLTFAVAATSCAPDDLPGGPGTGSDVGPGVPGVPGVATGAFALRHDVAPARYEDLGANRPPYLAGADYPDFAPVAHFSYRDAAGDRVDGTGVLVHPRYVLTAAHNLASDGERPRDPRASDMAVAFGTDFEAPTLRIAVEAAFLHPAWLPNEAAGIESGVDLAVLRLARAVDLVPSPIDTAGAVRVGATLYACGFGDLSAALGRDGYSRRRAFANVVDRDVDGLRTPRAFPGEDRYAGGLIACDFDSPAGDANVLANGDARAGDLPEVVALGAGVSTAQPLPLEGTSAPGDSGGPAYVRCAAGWCVAGVVSSGTTDSDYGDVAIFTRVSSHREWLRAVLR